MRKFLYFLLALLVSLTLAGCGGESDNGNNDANGSDSSNDSGENLNTDQGDDNKTYGIGDTVEIDGVKFTLKNVSLTDERNEFADTNPPLVVKIEYEIENNTDDEIPVGADLQVYDGTNNQVESYPLDNTLGSLQPGKKMQGVEHYGIEKGPIEIYFQPMFSFDDPAIFKVDIE